MYMQIGNLQEFQQQQLSKVEKRKKEEEKIKKGIYQMHVMVNDQLMETFTKECDKNDAKTENAKPKDNPSENGPRESRHGKTDPQAEMKRLLGSSLKIATMAQGI